MFLRVRTPAKSINSDRFQRENAAKSLCVYQRYSSGARDQQFSNNVKNYFSFCSFFFLRRTTEPMQKNTNQTKTPQKTFALHTENLKIFKAVRNCEGEKVVKSKMFLDCWLWLCLKCLLIFCLNISQYKLYGRGSQGRDLMLDLGYGSTRS